MEKNNNSIFKKYKRTIIAVLAVVILLVIGVVVFRNCGGSDRVTLAAIENVMPKEELYVMSSIMEDYALRNNSALFSTHKCVQIVEEQVGYKVSLAEISYEVISGDSVLVTMPEPEYYASTQKCKFYSDDEDYWKKELSDKNGLISEAKENIKKRFDTPNRRRQATNEARKSVTLILTQLGLTPVYANISSPEKH